MNGEINERKSGVEHAFNLPARHQRMTTLCLYLVQEKNISLLIAEIAWKIGLKAVHAMMILLFTDTMSEVCVKMCR